MARINCAAGRSLPCHDADRQRDRSGETDGGETAGRKPAFARPSGAAENGAVQKRGTGLVPVAAATALCMEVDGSFVGLERITAAAEEIRSRRTGTLRIAALPALSNGYLPISPGGS